MTANLEWAQQELRRRDAVEREWLGGTTEGRPSFTKAETLDRQGIPSCHIWQVPGDRPPSHLSAIEALRKWQAGACAMCSASRSRLLVDHCHETGLVRGLLCASCNTAEGLTSSAAFAAYRQRPPAVMLGVEEQYGSPWDGHDSDMDPRKKGERNAAHVDAAEALFSGIADRFRPGAATGETAA
ncbi:endonuclease domain-containing protein [Streptomyces sp. NPDC005071]